MVKRITCGICGTERDQYTRCVPCQAARSAARYEANKEQILAKTKERYYANPAKKHGKSLEWFRAHPGKAAEYTRRWREKNPDYSWYAKNTERHAAYSKEWRENNRDKSNGHAHTRRAKEYGVLGSHTAAEWNAVLKKLGSKCLLCGSKKQIEKDHIVPISRGGTNFAFNLQPLCRTCNGKKHARIDAGTQHSIFDKLDDVA